MAEEQYDLVILGGGTAGYVAAIRASQLGKKVAIVERSLLGGTCLHQGCIPTKALLKSAEVVQTVAQASEFGVNVACFDFDIADMMKRKQAIVDQMYQGVQHLMKQNHIDVYNGTGRILGPSIFSPQCGTIAVEFEDGESTLIPNQHVLIATGSRPAELPFLPFNHQTVLSSDDVLQLETLPHSIAIIGGGVIGLEFASLFNDLGVNVTVIEAGPRILPNESKRVAQTLRRSLAQKGVTFYENTALSEETVSTDHPNGVTIQLEDTEQSFDKCLVAIGRVPNTDDIGLNNTKVQTNQQQHIQTNAYQQTDESHIYAAGDCIGQLQLAHVGSKEGITAVDHMFDAGPIAVDYNQMPRCIYTDPEVASIGLSEEQAKEQGYEITVQKVPFAAIGKAVIDTPDKDKGFCEVVVDNATNDILGLAMIGPHVTELINEVSLLQFMNGSALELGLTTHTHPSLSEVLMELGLKIEGRSIHV